MKKGFVKDQTHHEMYWLVVGGKRTSIRTRLSHGEREADDSLQKLIAKQMRLSSADFDAFDCCTLGADRYAAMVAARP